MPLKTLGEHIRRERRRANLTIEELAGLAGISTSFMGYIERNERRASLETIDKLAKALRIPLAAADLFKIKPPPAADPVDDATREFAQLIRGQNQIQIRTVLKLVRMYIKTTAA